MTTQGSVANLTLPILLGRILQEDTMRQNSAKTTSTPSSSSPLAMAAFRGWSTSPSFCKKDVSWKSPSPRPSSSCSPSPTPRAHDIMCTYCYKQGHYRKDCWKRAFDKQKARQNANTQESHFAEGGGEESDTESECNIGLHFWIPNGANASWNACKMWITGEDKRASQRFIKGSKKKKLRVEDN